MFYDLQRYGLKKIILSKETLVFLTSIFVINVFLNLNYVKEISFVITFLSFISIILLTFLNKNISSIINKELKIYIEKNDISHYFLVPVYMSIFLFSINILINIIAILTNLIDISFLISLFLSSIISLLDVIYTLFRLNKYKKRIENRS